MPSLDYPLPIPDPRLAPLIRDETNVALGMGYASPLECGYRCNDP